MRDSLNVRESGERIELCERGLGFAREGEPGDDERELGWLMSGRPVPLALVLLTGLGTAGWLETDGARLRWSMSSLTRRIASSLTNSERKRKCWSDPNLMNLNSSLSLEMEMEIRSYSSSGSPLMIHCHLLRHSHHSFRFSSLSLGRIVEVKRY